MNATANTHDVQDVRAAAQKHYCDQKTAHDILQQLDEIMRILRSEPTPLRMTEIRMLAFLGDKQVRRRMQWLIEDGRAETRDGPDGRVTYYAPAATTKTWVVGDAEFSQLACAEVRWENAD